MARSLTPLRPALIALFTLASACGQEPEDARGSPCERDADCAPLACVAERAVALDDLEPLRLGCGDRGGAGEAGDACERGEQCGSGLCALAGACVQACSLAEDCPAEARCQRLFARGERDALHPVTACVARVDLPPGARVQHELREGAFRGERDELRLPAIERPTLFVIEHADDSSWPAPPPHTTCRPPLCAEALEEGDGALALFDAEQLEGSADGPRNPVALGDHVNPLTVLAPNGPRATPSPSGYRLRVESKAAGDARITRIEHTPLGGRLDLNVFSFEPTARTDEAAERLTSALEEVDRIFAPADVFVGEVRRIVVASALATRGVALADAEASRGFARLQRQYGVYPQLPELFKLGAGAGNVALDVFVVESFEALAEGELGGLSGGTPVPLGMHGTAGSGVAIATAPFASAADPGRALGRALAHELGHALGLFHTTERDGRVFDPLPDTPFCPLARDARGDGLDADDCADFGADNLMFPTLDASAATLTPDQRRLLAAAPILQ